MNQEECIKETKAHLMEKWAPLLKAGDRIPKLSKDMQENLVILLDNAERQIESRRIKNIFIPLTAELFLQIVEKKGDLKMEAMSAPVDYIGGEAISAGSRKLTRYQMGDFVKDIEKKARDGSIYGIDADAEIVNQLARHCVEEILKNVHAQGCRIFAPYILIFPRGEDVRCLMTRYGTVK